MHRRPAPGPRRHTGGARKLRRRLAAALQYALIAALLVCIAFPGILLTPPGDDAAPLLDQPEGDPAAAGGGRARQAERRQGPGGRARGGGPTPPGKRQQQQQQQQRPQGLFQIAAMARSADQQGPALPGGALKKEEEQRAAAGGGARGRRSRGKSRDDAGEDPDDDGKASAPARHRRRRPPHQHPSSRPPSQPPAGSRGAAAAGAVRGSYRGDREWEIGEGDRMEAMWETNLQDNLMAAESENAAQKKAHQLALQLEGSSIMGAAGHEQEAVDESAMSVGAGLRRFEGPPMSAEAAEAVRDNFHDGKAVIRSSKGSDSKAKVPPGKEKDWGWRCSHLNECEEWKKEHEKFNKMLASMEKTKKGPSRRELVQRNAGLRLWGAAAGRAADAGEEASCPPLPEGKQDSADVSRAVRECVRYLLAQRYKFLNIEEAAIRSEVGALMGIAMSDGVMKSIRQELKHVVRGPVEIIIQGFERQQAGEEINPPAAEDEKPGVIKKLSKKEQVELVQRENAAQLALAEARTEALRIAVAHSWGESRLAKTISEGLWEALGGVPGLRFRLAGAMAHGSKVYRPSAVMGELAKEEWQAGSESLPLALSLDLFTGPGDNLQLLEPSELNPTISIMRQGSVGTVLHEYKFKPSMLELLPPNDRAWTYGTCAVVGSSGMLLKGERYGTAIDSADAVIRVNMAPTHKYEKYVGTRTTFDVVSTRYAQLLLEGRTRSSRLINSTMVLFESTTPFSRDSLYLDVLRRFSGMDLSRSHVLVLSPHFVSATMQIWGQIRNSFEGLMHEVNATHTLYSKPDSGFYAIVFALQVCKHVNLYGMSNWRPGSKLRYHYFAEEDAVSNKPSTKRENDGRDTSTVGGKARSFDSTREILRAMSVWPGSDVRGEISLHKS